MKIPKFVYDRIADITRYVIDDRTQWTVNRRRALRLFLAELWLSETDSDGWVICTVRDIRNNHSSLLSECEINYKGERFNSTLADFLPRLPDIEFRKGKSNKAPEKRRSGQWQFNPLRPLSASGEPETGKLELVDLETGEAVKFKDLLKGNGKAPKHSIDLGKRQAELKRREKKFLAGVARGRMHISFVKELRSRVPDAYYRVGIRSLNHLFNARIEGQYVTYDHHYRLTFGGRYYDQAFQNLPNELKAKFRSGLFNYDIEACNLACLNYLFRKYGVDYRVKSSIYADIMKHTGLSRKQCKQMVHTTTYRIGRVTHGVNDGLGEKIYKWCGNSRKKALNILSWWDRYVSQLRSALEELLDRVRDTHHKSRKSPRNYHRYANEVGLVLDLHSEQYLRERWHHQQYAQNKALLAFMICGVEQAYIREVLRLNPGQVCMLDHDGLVTLRALVLPDWLGFKLTIK
ncbi:hypothetical protein [Pectobacterium versatile]|uniref:hypothetical protein n=1 Tax=Pectobacterium versatile TaxID=2488639 RepID=UPI00102ED5DD|nr:hypothetical protein [Pectobacterium versatile]TAJ06149.1 hypothetical protein EG334_02760 [Pectobacterium versatile]